MSGKFISLIMAASLAVTGMTAAPAQASDKDVARALAAIAGIAIIGAAIHDNNKKHKRHDPYVSSRSHKNHGYSARPYYGQKAHKQHRQNKKAYKQHRRQQAQQQAYRNGYNAHKRKVQERRQYRRAYGQGYGYGYNRGYGNHRY